MKLGDYVRKTKGSQWSGRIVGSYSTELTPVGWAVESSTERGSVQIYPEAALEHCDAQQERKPHTEAEVQELLGLFDQGLNYDKYREEFESKLRQLLKVEAP